jgi:hypothetical protein
LMNNRTFCAEIAHNVSARVIYRLTSDKNWNRKEGSTIESHSDKRQIKSQNWRKESLGLIKMIFVIL